MDEPNLRSRGTILLAEDEVLLRELGGTILRNAGYSVLTFASRSELELLIKGHPDDIDLLLTDVVMPEMSGQEVASAVRLRWPKARIIYTSGYSNEDVALIQGDAVFLQKPFTPGELIDKVQEVLGG